MKHFTDGSFKFSETPFPAFRSELVYGRNKRASEFLPTKVTPGPDGTLPEGQFRIIRTKEKGTLMVVPGEDRTDRALVFVGVFEGFRGGCSLHPDTTAEILKSCQAGNNTEGRLEVIGLISSGEKIVFHAWGRRTNEVVVHEYVGGQLKSTTYEKAEYLAAGDPADDYEVV